MGLRSFFKKVGKGVKKVAKYVAPAAALAAPFIPGVGGFLSGAVGKIGGLFGGSSAQANAPDPASQSDGMYTSPPVNVSASRSDSSFNWAKALGDIAPTAISGALGYLGQSNANEANAQAAQKQMDFQQQQTSTSYQRGVEDMKAAGLNPMLAYSQGGAASGGGASYQSGSELGAGANSAVQAAMTRQQLEQSRATIENINADSDNKLETTKNIEADTLLKLKQGVTEGSRNDQYVQDIIGRTLSNEYAGKTMGFRVSSAKYGADYDKARAQGEDYSLAEKAALSRFMQKHGDLYTSASRALEVGNSAKNMLNPLKGVFGR